MNEYLDLLDYRRTVAGIYAEVRASEPGPATWNRWRAHRDHLFANHPQTPIEDPATYEPLAYFEYHPSWRVEAAFKPIDASDVSVAHSSTGSTSFTKIGALHFELDGHDGALSVLWLNAYGGGIFVPFRDATNGTETYGGGRYILDTVKGADLGSTPSGLILDFNYAYHPSCVHSPRWSCPLAPPENRLDFRIEAGERLRTDNS